LDAKSSWLFEKVFLEIFETFLYQALMYQQLGYDLDGLVNLVNNGDRWYEIQIENTGFDANDPV